MKPQDWGMVLICIFSTYSNGAVQIRVGLALAEQKTGMKKKQTLGLGGMPTMLDVNVGVNFIAGVR